MEHLTAHNFGPIKELDIDIPRLLVLIGDQATGKSTICEMIYAFRTVIQNVIPNDPYMLVTRTIPLDIEEAESLAGKHFFSKFNRCYYNEDSFLVYTVSNDYSIRVTFAEGRPKASFSGTIEILFDDYNRAQERYATCKDAQNETTEDAVDNLRHISWGLVRALGANRTTEYIEASRSGSKAPLLGRLTASRGGSLTEQIFRGCMNLINITDIREEKDVIEYLIGGPFVWGGTDEDGFITLGAGGVRESSLQKSVLSFQRLQRISRQLIGGVVADGTGGQFELRLSGSATAVPYDCLSSGQKSMLPVITALLASTCELKSGKVLGTDVPFNSAMIEEPESHLFPQKQFLFVKLLAAAMSFNERSSFIITTHTPYVLSAIQALIAFGKVKDVSKMSIDTKDMTPISSDRADVEMYYLHDGTAASLREGESEFFDLTVIDRVSDEINAILDEASSVRFDEDLAAGERA